MTRTGRRAGTRARGASAVQYMVIVALVLGAIAGAVRVYGASIESGSGKLATHVKTQGGGGAMPAHDLTSALNGLGEGSPTDPVPSSNPDDPVEADPAALLDRVPTLGDDEEPPPAEQEEPPVDYDAPRRALIRGVPFVRGEGHRTPVHPADVSQGAIANCYFIAPLASIAHRVPGLLQSGIIRNPRGNGYLVRLFVDGRARWVPVDSRFPVNDDGQPIYAQPGQSSPRGQELWVMLYERAFASVGGGYNGIGHGGNAAAALEMLTGQPSTSHDPARMSFRTFAAYVNHGYAVVAGTPEKSDHELFKNDTLATWHAYWVESVDVRRGTVTLRNPWGWQEAPITLTWAEFRQVFGSVMTNPITPRAPARQR
ncbi:MAG: hypothetical protein KF819_28150 [Labilithrix sp.]|nr:hypothetical protein [Labilithrix sp.]